MDVFQPLDSRNRLFKYKGQRPLVDIDYRLSVELTRITESIDRHTNQLIGLWTDALQSYRLLYRTPCSIMRLTT